MTVYDCINNESEYNNTKRIYTKNKNLKNSKNKKIKIKMKIKSFKYQTIKQYSYGQNALLFYNFVQWLKDLA